MFCGAMSFLSARQISHVGAQVSHVNRVSEVGIFIGGMLGPTVMSKMQDTLTMVVHQELRSAASAVTRERDPSTTGFQ